MYGCWSTAHWMAPLWMAATSCLFVSNVPIFALLFAPLTDFTASRAIGAPIALDAVKSVKGANSKAKIGTFDTNKQLVAAIQSGAIQWAVDQQPYMQGYLAVDAIWWYRTNGDTLGGGLNVATGPAFIDKSNIDAVSKFAANGTR